MNEDNWYDTAVIGFSKTRKTATAIENTFCVEQFLAVENETNGSEILGECS